MKIVGQMILFKMLKYDRWNIVAENVCYKKYDL